MDAQKANEIVRIDLTPSQAETVKAATGREATALEFTVAELEDRIAPFFRLALTSNETLLGG